MWCYDIALYPIPTISITDYGDDELIYTATVILEAPAYKIKDASRGSLQWRKKRSQSRTYSQLQENNNMGQTHPELKLNNTERTSVRKRCHTTPMPSGWWTYSNTRPQQPSTDIRKLLSSIIATKLSRNMSQYTRIAQNGIGNTTDSRSISSWSIELQHRTLQLRRPPWTPPGLTTYKLNSSHNHIRVPALYKA